MGLRLEDYTGPRGHRYYAVGSIGGRRVNRSTGFTHGEKRKAKLRLQEIEAEVLSSRPKRSILETRKTKAHEGEVVPLERQLTNLIGLYFDKPGGLGETSKSYVEKFVAQHPRKDFESITPLDIIAFAKSTEKAGSTIRREINAIQGFVNYFRSAMDLPLIRVRKPAHNPPRSTTITLVQRQEIVDCCKADYPWFYPVLAFLILTGCRRGEACRLRWCDVLFEDDEPTVVLLGSRKGKQGVLNKRRVTLHSDLVPIIKKLRADHIRRTAPRPPQGSDFVFSNSLGDPIKSMAVINRTFNSICDAVGVVGRTPHDLRRTFATTLLRKKVSDHRIKDLLGHVDTKMLKTYSVIEDDLRRDAVETIDGI